MACETYNKLVEKIKMLFDERNKLEIEKYKLIEKFIVKKDVLLRDEIISINRKIKAKNDEMIEIENVLGIPNVFSKR